MENYEQMQSQIIRLIAMTDALKAFVISMFKIHPDRQLILEHYKSMQRTFTDKTLYGPEISDELLAAIDAAHARLLAQASKLGFPGA